MNLEVNVNYTTGQHMPHQHTTYNVIPIRMSETLNHHQCATVQRKAAIFEPI